MHYKKDEIIKMFDDDKICDYLFNNLIEYYSFFENLILPKQYIIKLLGKAKNYNQILNLLFYSGKDFPLFLEILVDEKNSILKLFNEESSKLEEEEKKIKVKKQKKEIALILLNLNA